MLYIIYSRFRNLLFGNNITWFNMSLKFWKFRRIIFYRHFKAIRSNCIYPENIRNYKVIYSAKQVLGNFKYFRSRNFREPKIGQNRIFRVLNFREWTEKLNLFVVLRNRLHPDRNKREKKPYYFKPLSY